MNSIDRANRAINEASDKVVDVIREGSFQLADLGMSLIEKDRSFHSANWTVQFTIGSPANSYEIFRGTHQECCTFFSRKLPSVEDEGWADAWEGTNPFKEACEVVYS